MTFDLSINWFKTLRTAKQASNVGLWSEPFKSATIFTIIIAFYTLLPGFFSYMVVAPRQ